MGKNFEVTPTQINMFDQRWYEIPVGNKTKTFRSVTTFLEAFPKGYGFQQWLKSVGFNSQYVLEQSQQFGSAFHGLIESLLAGKEINYHEEMDIRLWERIMIWYDFWLNLHDSREITYKPEAIESIVYSLEHEYAGTVDLICKIDDELTIIDWKTSNYIHDHWGLQLAAYAKALEEIHKVEVKNTWIVWFPEQRPNQKGYRILDNSKLGSIQDNFHDFLHVQKVYLRANPNETPKYKHYPTKIKL